MKTPNYHDFYQVALVPIGLADMKALKSSDAYYQALSPTHWLIVVEGVQLPQQKIYFHWKVSVYPADSKGDFNWKKPYYCSHNMELIEHAIKLASSFVAFSRKDELANTALLEKIS